MLVEHSGHVNGVWRTFNYDLSTHLGRLRYVAREQYAWPGGYELSLFIDGDQLCSECVREEYGSLYSDIVFWDNSRMETAIDAGCNIDPGTCYCSNCNKDLSSYAEDSDES